MSLEQGDIFDDVTIALANNNATPESRDEQVEAAGWTIVKGSVKSLAQVRV